MNWLAFPFAAVRLTRGRAAARVVPVADHHQHLFSPAITELVSTGAGGLEPITAGDVIGLLDAAAIRRALVLSVAYMYGRPDRPVDDEYAKVRGENDWTGAQVAQFPQRLRAFGSFNPLKAYAIDELTRCAKHPHLHQGIKLHFGNSDVQLDKPAHVEQLRQVFQAANEHRMAVVVHLRPSISLNRPYGRAEARVFLEQLLPVAPDISVQVAHLAGAGPGYDDPAAHDAMAVLAEAVANRDRRTDHLWFDVATVADFHISSANAELIVRRIRQAGVERILYGSDAATGSNLAPREGWAEFRRLPLTEQEFQKIASNVPPYFR